MQPSRPRLTHAGIDATREIEIVDAEGQQRALHIPEERPLTLFVDKHEVVTLMTLGQAPELLALGWLLNQTLVGSVAEVESVTVDWAVAAAAVRTHQGVAALAQRTARRTVTTGCGQGTVFGDFMAGVDTLRLPPPAESRVRQSTLAAVVEAMRSYPGVYRRAGSVHGTALFRGAEMLAFIEDVGRHNAVDTLSGWMAMHELSGADKLLCTTGRLTSEMVIKAARLGVPTVISRNGITAMGLDLASRLGLTLLGRASGRRFLCYTGAERIEFDAVPQLQAAP